jgi:hypothetical protein
MNSRLHFAWYRMEPMGMYAKIPQQATEPFERVVNYRTIVRITIARVWRRR